MEIPSIFDLNECNRLLGIANQIVNNENTVGVKHLYNACSSFTLGGRPMNHVRTLKYCRYVGFVSKRGKKSDNRVGISPFGKEFLDHNPEYNYEITDKQKEFIAHNIVTVCVCYQNRISCLFKQGLVLHVLP